MKQFKTLVALVLAAMMIVGTMGLALAQTEGTAAAGKGSITISNAAKDETYRVFKIFDATVDTTVNTGAISYTGTIPPALANYFTKDSVGVIRKNTTHDDDTIAQAVATYVATLDESGAVATAVSDGTPLTFAGLDYGYYGVTTSQGAVVSVNSNNPNVTIIDKNTVQPQVVKKVNGKDVDDAHIGETVTYTATFGPLANFIGNEQVQSYTISDTLPEFLTTVAITEVKVWNKAPTDNGATATTLSGYISFDAAKKIVIPWVDDATPAASLYANKSYITITYTAVIGQNPVINGVDEKNVNTVTITPNHDKTGDNPFDEHWSDDAEVKTYGAALKKVDDEHHALTGAQFTIDGYNVAQATDENGVAIPGVYRITGEKTGASAVMDTNDEGVLYILGMDETLSVTETKAPDGYNKLDAAFSLSKQELTREIWHEEGTKHFDAKGNLVSASSTATHDVQVSKTYTDLKPAAYEVVNNKGTVLPSTGGIGTTIFYVAGIVLVLGAAAIIIARRKAEQN